MHPVDMIFFWARSNPEQPALIQSDLVITYRELANAIESVTGRIAHYGFNKQEPVAVSIQQPIQKLIVCYALMRHGVSIAPVAPRMLPHLRSHDIYNLIFMGEGFMLSGGRNIRFENSWLSGNASRVADCGGLADDAAMIFISPTSARSLQRIVVPSDALMARVRMLPLIGETNYDRALILPSINSPSGFCRAAISLYAGRTACFAGDTPTQMLALNMFNIDTLVCSPQQATKLIDFAAKSNTYPFDSLREVWIEDGRLSTNLGRRIQTYLCRNVIAGYGSGISGRMALANFDMIADIGGAVGFIVPGASIDIVDDDGVSLPSGEQGRVRCRNEFFSAVFAASNPELGSADFWWYSGELGELSQDGILCIFGKQGLNDGLDYL
jgi:acyl-coenzyme A synthetase/AMP-(fatty) acid ligase